MASRDVAALDVSPLAGLDVEQGIEQTRDFETPPIGEPFNADQNAAAAERQEQDQRAELEGKAALSPMEAIELEKLRDDESARVRDAAQLESLCERFGEALVSAR